MMQSGQQEVPPRSTIPLIPDEESGFWPPGLEERAPYPEDEDQPGARGGTDITNHILHPQITESQKYHRCHSGEKGGREGWPGYCTGSQPTRPGC